MQSVLMSDHMADVSVIQHQLQKLLSGSWPRSRCPQTEGWLLHMYSCNKHFEGVASVAGRLVPLIMISWRMQQQLCLQLPQLAIANPCQGSPGAPGSRP